MRCVDSVGAWVHYGVHALGWKYKGNDQYVPSPKIPVLTSTSS